jgi:hypothetical protein
VSNGRRLALGVLLAAVLLWLWSSRQQLQREWSDPQYVRNHATVLNPQESSRLRSELGALLSAARIERTQLAVNEPLVDGRLNVYVTRTSGFRSTGCRPGDARYIAGPDIMLLDEGLVRPALVAVGYSSVGLYAASAENPAAIQWRRFVILHELGHRALHRSFAMQRGRSPRALEDEADRFAFDAIGRLSSSSTSDSDVTSVLVTSAAASVPPEDRPLVQMASVIQDLSVTLLFSGAHFSTFYQDTSHLAFAERFRGHLHDALARARDRITMSYLLLATEYLRRLEVVGGLVSREIQSPSPITDVVEHDRSLAISVTAADESLAAYTVTAKEWSSPGGALALADRPSAKPLAEDGSRSTVLKIGLGLLHITDADGTNARWELREEHGALTSMRPESEIVRQVGERMGIAPGKACYVNGAVPAEQSILVSFNCDGDFFVGGLRLPSLEVQDLELVRLPRHTEPAPALQLIDAFVDGERRTYLVRDMLTDVHSRAYELELWRVSPSRAPRLVARQPLAMDWIPAGAALRDWSRIQHPPLVLCSTPLRLPVLCTQFQDAVFVMDLAAEKLSVLFYPAGTDTLRLSDGSIAFWAKGGYKVFIIDPNRAISTRRHP